MTQKNTPALPQFPRSYSINVTTQNTSYTAPTNTGLLWTAGPDGADIWQVAAAATANQTLTNQLQLFTSADYGATFSVSPITGTLASGNLSQAANLTAANLAMPNGVPMGPGNPLILGGTPGAFTHTMAASLLTESATYFVGANLSGGTANAQTLATCYNAAGTQLSAAPATGTIVDFTCGVTNTTAATLALGAGAAISVTRFEGTALSAGDLTKGFRYRVIYSGTTWLLLPTTRLYCAVGQTQAATFTAWGLDR